MLNTQPITVQYGLTEHGKTLKFIVDTLTEWGIEHYAKIFVKQFSYHHLSLPDEHAFSD